MSVSATLDPSHGQFESATRWTMAMLFLAIGGLGALLRGRRDSLAFAAMVLTAIGQFPEELSWLGVPGIWFPFGVGVSRTQFAYAALIPCLGVLLAQENANSRSPRRARCSRGPISASTSGK
jgi:hypothetical protein